MAEGSGFDMSKMSTAGKILGGGGILYLIFLFLPWNQACADLGGLGGNFCVSANGLHGFGTINLLLVLAIVAMEVVLLMGIEVSVGTAAQRSMIDAGLTWALGVLTLLKVLLVDNEAIAWGAWVGLILSLVIAYGGFMRFQESKAGGSTPPAAG